MIKIKLSTQRDKANLMLRFLKETGTFSPFVRNRLKYVKAYPLTSKKQFFTNRNVPLEDLILNVDSCFGWSDTPEHTAFWANKDDSFRRFLASNLKKDVLGYHLDNICFVNKMSLK